MTEITLIGENGILSTWGWEIALYLFLGGLTAGLMIISGYLRVNKNQALPRVLLIADLSAFFVLSTGMFFLMLDLSNKLNLWRFYTTFKVQSVMSWGAWILLLTMILLFVRFLARTPQPRTTSVFKQTLFPPPPPPVEEGEETHEPVKRSKFLAILEWLWTTLHRFALWIRRKESMFGIISLVLGIGVGFYTGVLLSTIPARPLWNTAILAPLFLVSGLASAGAFLCLFLPREEHRKLAPLSILFCIIEVIFLAAYAINLVTGNAATQGSAGLLLGGGFGWIFWGLVLVAGLLVPAVLESLEMTRENFHIGRIPPVLKLAGGIALRFVIVYAGMLSFV